MPEKALENIKVSLDKAKSEGKEYHGEVTYKITNNKIVSVEIRLEIKQNKKITLA